MVATVGPLLVNSTEAAKMLDVSPKTLFNMRSAGEVPFVRIRAGRKGVRFSVLSLQNWITEQELRQQQAVKDGDK